MSEGQPDPTERDDRNASDADADAGAAPPRLVDLAKAMRLHQWAKNILLFVPMVTGQAFGLVGEEVLGFLLFGLCVSGVYLLNDVFDAEADRSHPTKRHRPIASGRVNARFAAGLGAALLAAALAGSAILLPTPFLAWVGVYLALNLLYTAWLKRKPIIDVLILAGFYALRIMLGGAAIGIEISAWLLAFSMFLFLSLALIKRYVDLLDMASIGRAGSTGRAYRVEDMELFRTLGPASGYMAVLVLALYVNSEAVASLYPEPRWLWLLCPLLLYWITRMWFITARRAMTADPLIFAARDKVSYILAALVAAVLVLAKQAPLH